METWKQDADQIIPPPLYATTGVTAFVESVSATQEKILMRY